MKKKIANICIVIAGTIMNAIGVGVFILPNNYIVGGATGFGRFISYYTGLPTSYSVGIVTVALFFVGLAALGKAYASTIVIGTFLYPVALDVISKIDIFSQITDDTFLTCCFAALILGVGTGMVMRVGGSVGGSDVLAMVFNRKKGISIAVVLNSVDMVALLLQCPFTSINEILYGALIIVLNTVVVNKVIMMGSNDAQFIVISKAVSEVNTAIQEKAGAGTTLLLGRTGYYGREQDVIICTIRKRDIRKVKDIILSIDPVAFITMMPASEVSGEGFTFARKASV